jgi:carboxypeptidase C (cathepsin A)
MHRWIRALAVVAIVVAPLRSVAGEAPVITRHEIELAGKPLRYTAEAGRTPIVDAGSKQVRAHIFYVAYRKLPLDAKRPVTFVWNGGPGANSTLLHFEALGPKRVHDGKLEDNQATPLAVTDLVFVDPVGTGFSRPTKPEYGAAFYSTLGDMAATAEFIRAWRAAHDAQQSPVFLAGESFGVWRAAGVAELMEKGGEHVQGTILISGGMGVATAAPREVTTALRIPNRAATALYHHKLPADLGTDLPKILQSATQWAENTYAPALRDIAKLSAEQRDRIALDLARFSGLAPESIDRQTLVVKPKQYLQTLLAEQGRTLNTFDMRISEPQGEHDAPAEAMLDYFRHELNYRTGLAYAGLEQRADPTMTLTPDEIGRHWQYDSGVITPEVMAAAMAGEGPPGAQPWSLRTIALNPKLRVMVAAGLYDSLNSCAANEDVLTRIDAAVARQFTLHCYSGGHMMYRDEAAHAQLGADIAAFVKNGE